MGVAMDSQAHSKPRRKILFRAVVITALLVLNLVILIAGHGQALQHVVHSFEHALRSVDPFVIVAYLWSNLTDIYFCFDMDCARRRVAGYDQLLGSFSILGIILYAVSFGIVGLAWSGWSDQRGGRVPTFVGFWVVVLGGTALAWAMRLMLLILTAAFGIAVGFVLWIDSLVIGILTVFLHGHHLFHQARDAGAAIKSASQSLKD